MSILIGFWLLYRHELRLTVRSPRWIAAALYQPMIWLFLIAPALNELTTPAGQPIAHLRFAAVPIIAGLVALYGSLCAVVGMLPIIRDGFVEHSTVAAKAPAALVLSRVLRDLTVLAASMLLLLVAGPFLAAVPEPGAVPVTIGLTLLAGLVVAACSYTLAISLDAGSGLAVIMNALPLPLVLLCGLVLPYILSPEWGASVGGRISVLPATDLTPAMIGDGITAAIAWQSVAGVAALGLIAVAWIVFSSRRVTA